ncbi:hypothetical protein Vafri_13170 [Volvox africanus]|uniref:Uncharacterized protein n=1 Tax=Volvox africanus TaxID=51714 RepID=A0A8J4BBH4_9CHLO|nr:hypothetical protein Vafri_13170 [Volvox africanus]
MGVDGPSSELGPLAQALQRRRAASSNQDQQAYAMGKFIAPPLPPNSPNRKPLSDCNMASKRVLGPNTRRPNEHLIPRPGAIDRQDRTCVGGAVHHRNCPESDQRTSCREQRPGVRGVEHRLSEVPDSEYQPSSAAEVQTRINATDFGKLTSAMENSGIRGNGNIFDQRPSATASCDPRPSSGSFEQRPNMTGSEPRPRPAASAKQRPNTMADSGQRPAPAVTFDTRPGAGAPFEKSPSQGGVEQPNDAGSMGKRPGVLAAFDPHHNGVAGFQPRPSSASAVNPRPSAASDFELNRNASVGPQSNAAEGSEPSQLVSARSLRTPKPSNVQPQKPYANLATRPQPQQQASKVQQQPGSYQAGLQRPSTSSLEPSSVGPLTAAAASFASSQRHPSAAAAVTLRASTGALPATSEKTTEPISIITGIKGMKTTATVAMRARSSADSISWMDICAEGRAEADRKRGLTLPNDHKSELKQWLYHDIMQRQGHPLHVPKNIAFPSTQPGVSLPPQLVR